MAYGGKLGGTTWGFTVHHEGQARPAAATTRQTVKSDVCRGDFARGALVTCEGRHRGPLGVQKGVEAQEGARGRGGPQTEQGLQEIPRVQHCGLKPTV